MISSFKSVKLILVYNCLGEDAFALENGVFHNAQANLGAARFGSAQKIFRKAAAVGRCDMGVWSRVLYCCRVCCSTRIEHGRPGIHKNRPIDFPRPISANLKLCLVAST
ncbi:hypothetical protein MLD38_015056 [Melastoma candidum]|uniref:Uncharacterized protein n=1 Tax=Melastoma candidum TaxID=119954 RepID=A0ACB9RG75_9MYRT|nr:hypothetical protein MLD38_015056 [Melastoma candidum]